MADNITLNAGTGGVDLRTDDDGTAHWQYVKLAFGADNTQTIVGSTSSNPLPVALSDTDNTVLDNIQTAVEVIDNAVHADDAAFTLGTHSGVMMMGFAGTQSVDANDAGAIAMETDGSVHIHDGGNTITVDGTVTANLSATDNAVLDNIQTAVEIIDNAISGTEMQVDVVAALPTGSNTIGDVTISGNALTALQLIDDPVATDDTTTHSTGTTKVMGIGAVATPTDGSVEANDIGMPAMSTDRRLLVDAQIVGTDAALDVSAATVTVTATNLDVQSGGADLATSTQGSAIQTAVEIMDDWDETNRCAVNTISGQVGVAGGSGTVGATTQRVVLATDVALPAGTNAIGKLAANSGIDIGDVDILSVTPGVGASNLGKAEDAAHSSADVGVMSLAVRTDTQAARAGTTGDYIPLTTDALGALYVHDVPGTANGLTIFRSIDIDETEEAVKATAGNLYSIAAFNTTAAPLYLKLYNATVATVVVGTTTPVMTLVVPGNADSDGAGFVWSIPQGITFSTAITVACTTGVADNDTGAPGANACIVNCLYK